MAKVGYSINYDNFERFTEQVNAALSKARWDRWLKEASQIAYQKAMQLCPIDTGWMQGQMYVDSAAEGFTLGNDAEYSSHHEYGWLAEQFGGSVDSPKHYKGGYRPFIRPGIIEGQKYFERQLAKWLENLFKYGN
ncbi:MAG: hypothetical protein ACOC5T_09930 [Elusimicrobiota bacterium]